MRVDAGVSKGGTQLGCRSPRRIGVGSLVLGGSNRRNRFLWKDSVWQRAGDSGSRRACAVCRKLTKESKHEPQGMMQASDCRWSQSRAGVSASQ